MLFCISTNDLECLWHQPSQEAGYSVFHLDRNTTRNSFFLTRSHIIQSVLAQKAVMHHRPDSRPGLENAVHSLPPTAQTQSHARRSVGGFHDDLWMEIAEVSMETAPSGHRPGELCRGHCEHHGCTIQKYTTNKRTFLQQQLLPVSSFCNLVSDKAFFSLIYKC